MAGHLDTIALWQRRSLSSSRRPGKAFFAAFPFSVFPRIEWWAACCCQAGRNSVCIRRWGPAMFFGQLRSHASSAPVLICLKRKTGFKHSWCGCVYSGRSQLLCCSHIYIYSVLDIWVQWQIMTYLHAVFVWQHEHRWSLSPWAAFMQPCYWHSWVLYVVSFL